jgi:hypothetical protein
VIAQEPEPVGFVSSLGLGKGQQDIPFLTAAVLGQVPVDGSLGTFIGEVLAPSLDVGGAGGGDRAGRSGCCVLDVGGTGLVPVRFSVLRHEHSWA